MKTISLVLIVCASVLASCESNQSDNSEQKCSVVTLNNLERDRIVELLGNSSHIQPDGIGENASNIEVRTKHQQHECGRIVRYDARKLHRFYLTCR